MMRNLTGALLAAALLTGCHSEGTILFEFSKDGATTGNVENLQADADHLYFIRVHGDADLMKMPKSGGTPSTVAPGVFDYVITGDTIVFHGRGALFEVTADGRVKRELFRGGVFPNSLFATTDKVYWVEDGGSDGRASILSMPRDRSHGPEVLAASERKPRNVRADAAGNVFWSTQPYHEGDLWGSAELRMVPAGGGPPVTVLESSDWGHAIEIIAFDDAFLYTDAEPGELHRVPRAGGPSEVIARLVRRTQLTVFDGTLYGCETPDGRIFSLPATGGDLHEIAVGHPESIAVDAHHVYWANAIFREGGREEDLGPATIYPASIARAER